MRRRRSNLPSPARTVSLRAVSYGLSRPIELRTPQGVRPSSRWRQMTGPTGSCFPKSGVRSMRLRVLSAMQIGTFATRMPTDRVAGVWTRLAQLCRTSQPTVLRWRTSARLVRTPRSQPTTLLKPRARLAAGSGRKSRSAQKKSAVKSAHAKRPLPRRERPITAHPARVIVRPASAPASALAGSVRAAGTSLKSSRPRRPIQPNPD